MSLTEGNTIEMTGSTESESSLASAIFNQWLEWKNARREIESRWTEIKKYVFATSTKDTTNAENPWSNTTHRPKLYNIYNNLLVNTDFSLFPNRDWMDFYGYDEKSNSKEKRKAALAYLTTKHRLSDFRKVMKSLESDWLLTGNCFSGVEYVTETTEDPVTKEQVPSYIGPRPYRIAPQDIVFNPTAINFESTAKIVRYFTTIGDLERITKEQPSLNYSEDLIKKMKEDRIQKTKVEDDEEKNIAFSADGFGTLNQYYNEGHAIIYELQGDFYDKEADVFLKNYVITVADGLYVLRKEPLNTYSGKPHIYQSVWKNRPDNLWGFGPLENLVGLQYRIDHIENGRADAFDNMIDPDRIFFGDVEVEKNGAAINYYVESSGGNVKNLVPDTTVLNASFDIKELENSMELYANAPRESLGIRSPGEKTAFEVDTLKQGAERAYEYQTFIFSSFVEEIVNAELELARINLSGSDIVSVIDSDFGVQEFLSITREDLTSNGKVIPVGARESARKAKIAKTLAQFYRTGLADPEVLQHFPSEKLALLWSEILDIENLFVPYGRIAERLEAETRTSAAQDILKERNMINANGVTPNGNTAATGNNPVTGAVGG